MCRVTRRQSLALLCFTLLCSATQYEPPEVQSSRQTGRKLGTVILLQLWAPWAPDGRNAKGNNRSLIEVHRLKENHENYTCQASNQKPPEYKSMQAKFGCVCSLTTWSTMVTTLPTLCVFSQKRSRTDNIAHWIPGGALLSNKCALLRSVYKRHFCKTQNVLNKTTKIHIPAARKRTILHYNEICKPVFGHRQKFVYSLI